MHELIRFTARRKTSVRTALVACALTSHLTAHAKAPDVPEYAHDVTQWQEVSVPPEGRNPERAVWRYAANYSPIAWRVYLDQGQPRATLLQGSDPYGWQPVHPPFEPEADNFVAANRFTEVDDGWLVGFSHGEFGAALYWFSKDGKHHYKISNDQVVAFYRLQDGLYAIEGLQHFSSCGSMLRVARTSSMARWQAHTIMELPFAPGAISVKHDGTMLITLSDSLISVSPDHHVKTLIAKAPWETLYPSSSVMSPDESRLYIGMRQFVGEVDLATNQLRLLIPSRQFLNKLPEDQERRIRAQAPEGEAEVTPPAEICRLRKSQ
jgi:hypothetical protein